MHKTITSSILAVAFLILPTATSAQTTATTTTSVSQVQALLVQIQALQKQIAELEGKQATVRQELSGVISLTRNLVQGMSGEDVKTLQTILATDPEIYPEGLITGFFGSLTEKAVKKFQNKFGVINSGTA